MDYQGPSTTKWRFIICSDSLSEIQEILAILQAHGKYDHGVSLSHVRGPEDELQVGWETTLVARSATEALQLTEEKR